MAQFRLIVPFFILACLAGLPARVQVKPAVGVGDSLFACASARHYGQIVGFAVAGDLRSFAQSLMKGVHSEQCILFQTDQNVILTGKTRPPGLVQVKPVGGTHSYWTSRRRLSSVKLPLPKHYGEAATRLYLGEGSNQPLVAGFGGSEGGNAWASDHYGKLRQTFLNHGYALLTIAYFQRQPPAGQGGFSP